MGLSGRGVGETPGSLGSGRPSSWAPFLDRADIVDIKPANMEDLTEVITASEFHPHHCNLFVYSSSKGSLRLCDMRAAALCDKHSKRKCPCPRQAWLQRGGTSLWGEGCEHGCVE